MRPAFDGPWLLPTGSVQLSFIGEFLGRAIRRVEVRHDAGRVTAMVALDQVRLIDPDGSFADPCNEIEIDLTPQPPTPEGFRIVDPTAVLEALQSHQGDTEPSRTEILEGLARLARGIVHGVESSARDAARAVTHRPTPPSSR